MSLKLSVNLICQKFEENLQGLSCNLKNEEEIFFFCSNWHELLDSQLEEDISLEIERNGLLLLGNIKNHKNICKSLDCP